MAKYHYDEAGNMAAYFLLTFLALILVPSTFLLFARSNFSGRPLDGCLCKPCVDKRKRVKSLLKPKISKKTYFLMLGWSLFGYISYQVANAKLDNKIYDPFEILGLGVGSSEKEIKSHYKKLSKIYHPDKVKATVNNTIDDIQNRFVELTKAYKSLTDETIRENLEKYGHPDGRQDVSMGIALPQWIVEGKNNIWVLGIYGLIFGGALPALVGQWWFGSRRKTKDGVNALSAAAFFKSLKEESDLEAVIAIFGKAFQWELPSEKIKSSAELDQLGKIIRERAGSKWDDVTKLCGDDAAIRKGLTLIYAHLLRIPVHVTSLQREQNQIINQTPLLLNALLNISVSRNWLLPTISVMRLHAHLVQALLPGSERSRFAQLPGINIDELATLAPDSRDLIDFVHALEKKQDGRVVDVKKAIEKWGHGEIVDAAFRVIGDRVVTPSSIVFLFVKLRLSPPSLAPIQRRQLDADETKRIAKFNEEKDEEFLTSRKDAEDLPSDFITTTAHAPYWPGERKPSWWLILADEKSNRVVVPPMRVVDIPFAQPNKDRDYRLYKIQFQAPQAVGVFTWKVHLVSDTFVGEDTARDITLKIEDVSTLDAEEPNEDEISDPEEDTIAGQMSIMRGGSVKRNRTPEDEESDEESSTDDDQNTDSSDDSDSD